jgi:hypothetical protein
LLKLQLLLQIAPENHVRQHPHRPQNGERHSDPSICPPAAVSFKRSDGSLRDDPSAEINLTIMRSAGVIAGTGAFR